MAISPALDRFFRRFIPEPLTLAVILTFMVGLAAMVWGNFPDNKPTWHSVLQSWYQGIWNPPLLVFMVQMLLILVLGHALALAKPVDRIITALTGISRKPGTAVAVVCAATLAMSFLNWGLGLIFGAILARKMGEKLSAQKVAFNYPLLGAVGYAGFMIWHGGISGSAPLKAAEPGHLQSLMQGMPGAEKLPESIPLQSTIFGSLNLTATVILFLTLPLLAWFLARRSSLQMQPLEKTTLTHLPKGKASYPAEKLDRSPVIGVLLGALVLITAFLIAQQGSRNWGFITPNFINFVFLGLGLILHGSLYRFGKAINEAVRGASGIVIQFPLYFGIMGILKSSGLIAMVSHSMLQVANADTLPLFTFFSAGMVNFFVPSGGGQWAIQGPIILQAAQGVGLPLPKGIMALAYGDQITNMMQPFWALPLLSITGLKARDILPYTLLFMIFGAAVYLAILILM